MGGQKLLLLREAVEDFADYNYEAAGEKVEALLGLDEGEHRLLNVEVGKKEDCNYLFASFLFFFFNSKLP